MFASCLSIFLSNFIMDFEEIGKKFISTYYNLISSKSDDVKFLYVSYAPIIYIENDKKDETTINLSSKHKYISGETEINILNFDITNIGEKIFISVNGTYTVFKGRNANFLQQFLLIRVKEKWMISKEIFYNKTTSIKKTTFNKTYNSTPHNGQ